jgi:hypothetical protein
MANSVADKLKIKTGDILLSLNAPPNFKRDLGELPEDVSVTLMGKTYNQIHWFVMNKAQLEKELSKVLKMLQSEILVWVYYPKGTGNMQTDLTRDKGWDSLLSETKKLTWVSLISFDDNWSAFGFRAKTEADKKKDAKPKVREIFNWVNPTTKEVKLPDDLAEGLKAHKKQNEFFKNLSFTNKKEYIEWVITAKQAKTRAERITESIDRMSKGWKNPRNL